MNLFYDFSLIIIGCILAMSIDWLFRFWRRGEDSKRLSEAREVLKKHGLTPELYLAGVGTEAPELRRALDEFTFSGYIIMNDQGEVIGKLCPRVEALKQPLSEKVISNEE